MHLSVRGLVLALVLIPAAASAQEIDCLKCHAKLGAEKVVHAALGMGCSSCHTGIDARKTPHAKTTKVAKGLSAEQPDVCYGCHDKALFEKKTVHAAVGMGCTGCHDPHSSKNAKLLKTEAPELCMTCHDKTEFNHKTVHPPVAGGMCLSCHSPHATDDMALLLKKPVDVCLECHPDIPKKPHVIAGFGSRSHPVGLPKQAQGKKKEQKEAQSEQEPKKPAPETKDPARPDKVFYCGSCHFPHSSDTKRLLRFNARNVMEICTQCHKNL